MVQYAHTILRKALSDAAEEGRVVRNVATLGTVRKRLPQTRRPEQRTWTAEELGRFVDHLDQTGDPLYPAFLLAATSGLRRGELLGLRWSDVNLERGRAAVRQTVLAVRDVDADKGTRRAVFGTPKTARGLRTVPLPAQTVAALRVHRKRQLAERLKVGPDFVDHDLVFCEPDGRPHHPDRFAKRFMVRARHARVPVIRFHDLRHTYATLALQAGVHPKVVSDMLGHANIGITLDTYSHVMPAMQEQAAESIAALVFGGA
jgi:integrase